MRYCPRCKREVPMLEESEYAQVWKVYMVCVERVIEYRTVHDTTLAQTPVTELYEPATRLIAEITGTSEYSLDEVIRRHRIGRWKG